LEPIDERGGGFGAPGHSGFGANKSEAEIGEELGWMGTEARLGKIGGERNESLIGMQA